MNNNESFGFHMRRLRKQKGMTQYDLADALGVKQSTINNLEKGRNNPSWELAQKVAALFGVTLNDMASSYSVSTPCLN